MQGQKRTLYRLLDKSLALVFVLSLIGSFQAQSETPQPDSPANSEPHSASMEWRSPTKGYWEYAEENWLFTGDGKKVIPAGYGVIVLDESNELTPLTDHFLESFCQDQYPLPGSLEVKSVVALLYHGQIPSATEIQTICTIMETLLFKEKWSQG
jgi:hypothetical protein